MDFVLEQASVMKRVRQMKLSLTSRLPPIHDRTLSGNILETSLSIMNTPHRPRPQLPHPLHTNHTIVSYPAPVAMEMTPVEENASHNNESQLGKGQRSDIDGMPRLPGDTCSTTSRPALTTMETTTANEENASQDEETQPKESQKSIVEKVLHPSHANRDATSATSNPAPVAVETTTADKKNASYAQKSQPEEGQRSMMETAPNDIAASTSKSSNVQASAAESKTYGNVKLSSEPVPLHLSRSDEKLPPPLICQDVSARNVGPANALLPVILTTDDLGTNAEQLLQTSTAPLLSPSAATATAAMSMEDVGTNAKQLSVIASSPAKTLTGNKTGVDSLSPSFGSHPLPVKISTDSQLKSTPLALSTVLSESSPPLANISIDNSPAPLSLSTVLSESSPLPLNMSSSRTPSTVPGEGSPQSHTDLNATYTKSSPAITGQEDAEFPHQEATFTAVYQQDDERTRTEHSYAMPLDDNQRPPPSKKSFLEDDQPLECERELTLANQVNEDHQTSRGVLIQVVPHQEQVMEEANVRQESLIAYERQAPSPKQLILVNEDQTNRDVSVAASPSQEQVVLGRAETTRDVLTANEGQNLNTKENVLATDGESQEIRHNQESGYNSQSMVIEERLDGSVYQSTAMRLDDSLDQSSVMMDLAESRMSIDNHAPGPEECMEVLHEPMDLLPTIVDDHLLEVTVIGSKSDVPMPVECTVVTQQDEPPSPPSPPQPKESPFEDDVPIQNPDADMVLEDDSESMRSMMVGCEVTTSTMELTDVVDIGRGNGTTTTMERKVSEFAQAEDISCETVIITTSAMNCHSGGYNTPSEDSDEMLSSAEEKQKVERGRERGGESEGERGGDSGVESERLVATVEDGMKVRKRSKDTNNDNGRESDVVFEDILKQIESAPYELRIGNIVLAQVCSQAAAKSPPRSNKKRKRRSARKKWTRLKTRSITPRKQ